MTFVVTSKLGTFVVEGDPKEAVEKEFPGSIVRTQEDFEAWFADYYDLKGLLCE